MADRYSYVPLVGIFIALVWLIEESTRPWRNRYIALTSAALAVLFASAALTRIQIANWKDSEVLFRRALAVTQNNALAHMDLGCALLAQEKNLEAKSHFEEALRIWPDYSDAAGNLGVVQMSLGEVDDAIRLFTVVTKAKPNVAKPHYLLGNALDTRGNRDEAILHFRRALEIDPNFSWALNDLAWILATDPDPIHRNGNEAVKSAEQACRLKKFKDPLFIGTLAAAYAEANRFDDAIKTAEQARQVALSQNNKSLAERNLQLIEEYRAHQPHRESVTPAPDAKATRIPN
jgi:tetratricopeptide (TPR) repeat protein